MHTIVPGVSTLRGMRLGRVYLLEGSDGLTLIDTALAGNHTSILKQLAQAGHQPAAIKRILITHAHVDHIGALPALKQATGAQVIATAPERPVIEGKQLPLALARDQLPWLGRFMVGRQGLFPPTTIDRLVADGERLPEVLGGLEAIATPGHAPGHVAWWQPERRILFCGDVLMRMFFNRLSLPFAWFTPDMAVNKRSVRRLVELEPEVICFGHGPPMTQQASKQLRAFAQRVGAI